MVLARDRVAIDVGGIVVRSQLRLGPIPNPGRDIAAEGLEVRWVIRERRRVSRRTRVQRALRGARRGCAVMRLIAHAEFQVLPGAVIDLELAVELRPFLRVSDIDIGGTEYPTECHRYAAGRRRVVDRIAEIEVRSRPKAVQLVAGAAAQSGVGLGHILVRRFAVTPGITDLCEEAQGTVGIPSRVEIDEVRGSGFIGPRYLIVDPVEGARDTGEVRLG